MPNTRYADIHKGNIPSFTENIKSKNFKSDGTINDDFKASYNGLNLIYYIINSVYSQEVYQKLQDNNTRDIVISKLNDLIDDYNSNYLGNDLSAGQWVSNDFKDVCDPNFQKFPCNPKQLLGLTELPRLTGNLRVKNKEYENCYRLCGPDCGDKCFYTPTITNVSDDIKKFMSTLYESCACIPCFEYVQQDGKIKCFQKDIIPDMLQILLDNFKRIYAITNDSNPRTAYYIYSDDFENEYDVKDDIRLKVKIIKEFIQKCRNPLSKEVQDECSQESNTRNAANPNCENSEKIFCKNVDIDVPNADIKNCITNDFNILDIIKDNINAYLNPTDIDHCYCQVINPITGEVIEQKEKIWMDRETCDTLNSGGENFHICSDDSFANETLKKLKNIKSECNNENSGNKPSYCPNNNTIRDSKNYESYLFNFDYKNGNVDMCSESSTDDIKCLSYSILTERPPQQGGGQAGQGKAGQGTTQSFINERENIKNNSIFRYATKNYCYCHQKESDKCNNWGTCFGIPTGDINTEKDTCSNVHNSIFGDTPSIHITDYFTMTDEDLELAKHNIINRNICEGSLRCMGYTCENGGADNSYGSTEPHNSNMSYIRDIFFPLTPSYTGKSIPYSIFNALSSTFNTNNQSTELSTKPLMNSLGYGPNTVTKLLSDTICNYGKTVNQYGNIDARAAIVENNDNNVLSTKIWQALNPLSYGKCVGEEMKTLLSALPGVDPPNSHFCSDLASADSGFFGNLISYVDNYVNSLEDSVVASSLNYFGGIITNYTCETGETTNEGVSVDYGYYRNYLIYIVAIIIFLIAIPTIGPISFCIALIITIMWKIYGFIRDDLVNIEDLPESGKIENKISAILWILLFMFIPLFVIYLYSNKKIRHNLLYKSRKLAYEMKDDISHYRMFD